MYIYIYIHIYIYIYIYIERERERERDTERATQAHLPASQACRGQTRERGWLPDPMRRKGGRLLRSLACGRTFTQIPVSVKKKYPGLEDRWENMHLKYHISGWIAVSAAGLQGKGLHKRYVVSQTPVSDRHVCTLASVARRIITRRPQSVRVV